MIRELWQRFKDICQCTCLEFRLIDLHCSIRPKRFYFRFFMFALEEGSSGWMLFEFSYNETFWGSQRYKVVVTIFNYQFKYGLKTKMDMLKEGK